MHLYKKESERTTTAGQKRGDVHLRSYLQDAAGRQSLVFDLSMNHDRLGSSSHVQQNGLLWHHQDLDAPLRLAALRKINSYKQQYADLFSPPLSAQAHACTASFCVFFFYRPTGRPRRTSLPLECHRNATNRTRLVSSTRHSTSR